MPGVKSYGFHEGSRSEYLAQYAFASWGTAVVIPQQEDHGLDLHCTLMERIGARFLAKAPYNVQVKSEMKPIVFEGKDTVRWLIDHPLPFFLCIVDKATAWLSIYQTLARFQTWSLGIIPNRVSMVPAPVNPGVDGQVMSWPGGDEFEVSIDQPILEFTTSEMLNDDFWQSARNVFEKWIEVENDNITRVRKRLFGCQVPDRYRTNKWTMQGWSSIALGPVSDDQVKETVAHTKEPLEWLGDQLLRKGDIEGAAKAALLHRHLFNNESAGMLDSVQFKLNELLVKRHAYVFAGVDHLATMVKNALATTPPAPSPPPAAPNIPLPDIIPRT